MNLLLDMLSGMAAGVSSCLSGYFLDTVKVRMQIDPTMTSITHSNISSNTKEP
jgi:hypothetical protein